MQIILFGSLALILKLVLAYITVSQLFRFAIARSLACGGLGSLDPPRGATLYLWPEDCKKLGGNRCLHCD